MNDDLKYIIEGLVFVSEDPLTTDEIRRAVGNVDGRAVRDALAELTAEYRERDGGFYLAEVAGGFQFRTQSRHTPYIKRMVQPNAPRLSKAAMETLAIIAYKQPVMRSDIEHIRGVDCGGVLRMLLERKLIRILGRKEIPGRPLIYGTTKLFLQVFDLKDLSELPSPKEIEEMADKSEASVDDGETTPDTGEREWVQAPVSEAAEDSTDGVDNEDLTDAAPVNPEPVDPTDEDGKNT